ncbi:MAG: c-type cytochrome [Candidatus Promineifilaceae bacterium]
MQTKVIIGTIAFMLAMIILGFSALFEPARMAEMTAAREARIVEDGAALFQANCATCHGQDGRAEECLDAGGNPTACIGRPLNHPALLCGEPTERMAQLNWAGTLRDLIHQTIAAGRLGTAMPTWSEEFGGPMEDYQIEQVTSYVLNWEDDPELCPETGEDGEEPAPPAEWPEDVAELPAGDAARGQALYADFGCVGCHGDPGQPDSNPVGPWLGNIANVAATRVEGASAEQYIYASILNPNNFIAPICARGQPCGEPSAMPLEFGEDMSLQDMADIVAYYMTLSAE